MKKLILSILTLLIGTQFLSKTYSQITLSKDEFLNPPNSSKVHIWWHWVDGAVNKEGITKDLESMKKQGIVQATILNVTLFESKSFGVPQVKFNSSTWYEMFQFALQEAARLNISIGAHNCDGWSSSGGPWISPEMSMKQYTWTKTIVKGGENKTLNLVKPYNQKDFYKDVAVLAYKTLYGQNSFKTSKPKITINKKEDASVLMDGNPVSGKGLKMSDTINIDFKKDFTADKIVIHVRKVFVWAGADKFKSNFSVFSSSDGKIYKKIKDFELIGLYKSFTIPITPSKAKFYQVVRNEITEMNDEFSVSEIELLKSEEVATYAPQVHHLMEKAVFVKSELKKNYEHTDTAIDTKLFIDPNTVLDLSDKMDLDGTLNWTAPEGDWCILRFGYTTTNATNAPASPEGSGLECDKMDASAVDFHFKNYPQKLINSAGKYAGNTFKFILVDSWECGFQNWTQKFPTEFEKLRGYNFTKWLPVLCGETVGNVEESEAFLYDFRRTIADLIEVNYYKKFGELCHQQKMEFHAEVVYGDGNYPPVDILKANGYLDLPMFEFWSNANVDNILKYIPTTRPFTDFPMYAALLYNRPIVGAEAYTGMAHFSESPKELKPFGDKAYCSGMNQLILHSYVHQPLETKPGITLGQYGSSFNRNNPYWNQSSEWINYQSRVQYVLQKGKEIFDVLYYIGDQLPQYMENKFARSLPPGYRPIPCNYDILKNKTTVKDGKIILDGIQSLDLIILPDNKAIELTTLKRIAELISEGAVAYGDKPIRTLSLSGIQKDQKEFQELTAKIWGNVNNKLIAENSYGKGKVIWGKPISEVLNNLHETPKFRSNVIGDSLNLMYIHKRIDEKEIFFVFNQQNFSLNRECIFRVGDKSPEIWSPSNGTTIKPSIYSVEHDQVRIPVSFKPYESFIFVFEKKNTPIYFQKVSLENRQIFPLLGPADTTYSLPDLKQNQNNFSLTANKGGHYTFTTNKGIEKKISLKDPEILEIKDFKGQISFSPIYKKEIKSVEIINLKPLNEFEDTSIKYFSGNAHYSIKFNLPSNYIAKKDSILLSIGKVDAVAEVSLNNKSLGTVWLNDFMIPVNNLMAGENHLDILVATTVRNRITGDFKESGSLKNIWTSAPVESVLNTKSQLKPTGLLGPIRLVKYSPQIVKE